MSEEKSFAISGNFMSRLARKPIEIPETATVAVEDGKITVKGPKGEIKRDFLTNVINISNEDGNIYLKPRSSGMKTESKVLLGTYVSHIRNMLKGVLEGFQKKLIIEGVGYKAEARGNEIVLSLGFSHPVIFKIPEGISVSVNKNIIIIDGIDKEKVGLAASKIRALKKPEPYKGKGIRYEGEVVRRKAGKKTGA